ncbi:hypothetical protein L7F22_041905 [Adiantum nelumboides]|nr:hypothetical protein [Adiantum nelumboides]
MVVARSGMDTLHEGDESGTGEEVPIQTGPSTSPKSPVSPSAEASVIIYSRVVKSTKGLTMMGPEDDSEHGHANFYSGDALESLVLDPSPHPLISSSDYESTMSGTLPAMEDSHPLSAFREDKEEESFDDRYRKSPLKKPTSRDGQDDPLVEPPSYADVIFSSFTSRESSFSRNGNSKDVGLPLSSSSSASSFLEYLTITVSQPQKMQDSTSTSIVPGSNTYVTYLILTHTNIPKYGGQNFSVRRRFRDVVTLADKLAEAYRGYFVPARPDKSIVESQVMQKQEFIEQRRVALEKYLRRLANHPVVRMSDELRVFLQSQGKLPLSPTTDMASRMLDGAASLPRQLFGEGNALMTPQDVVQPAKSGRDLVRLFKELKQSVTIEWGGAKPAVIEDDREFLEKKESLDALEHHLSEASQQAENLVKAQQEVGETMGELGLAFIKLAKFETEEAVHNSQRTHAADAKRLATAAVKASRFYREANAQSLGYLDQLHEYLNLMQSVHTAFNDRSNALLTAQILMTEIASLNIKIEKLAVASSKVFGGDRSRMHKIEEMKEALQTTELARDTAVREYERIKNINHKELDRCESERQKNFLEMIKGFVHNQVGYAEKIESVWVKMIEESNPHGKLPELQTPGTPRP